jgi:hypothetical protein
MIRFEIAKFILLLYEVPYISVPTLSKEDRVTDEEFKNEVIKDRNEEELLNSIRIKQSKL